MHDERLIRLEGHFEQFSNMKSYKDHLNQKKVFKSLFYTFIFDTVIAIFLTAIKFGAGFQINFIISQCIGLSICTCVLIVHCLFDKARPILKAVLVATALTLGSICGSYVGSWASGLSPSDLFERHSLLQLMFLGVMFGSVITYFFASSRLLAESRARIQEEKIKVLTIEKKAAEANLKLLQAQIEPHFLFNTLSNILSLLDTNPQRGKSMLVDFIKYLRSSLSKIREDRTTLGQEMDMIQAYLNILKVRMGDRLNYQIDVPNHLESNPFPPMLVQPIVENAIKHGLEPKVDGGKIIISGREKDGKLQLEIVDTGVGFAEDRESGLGLANIRERLFSIYGNNGKLILEENSPQGLKATIEVPHGQT